MLASLIIALALEPAIERWIAYDAMAPMAKATTAIMVVTIMMKWFECENVG